MKCKHEKHNFGNTRKCNEQRVKIWPLLHRAAQISCGQEYPNGFRGFFGFEKYTDEQLATLKELLTYWKQERYGHIPLTYNENMWDITDAALRREPGLYTHVSYRDDKSDCHPQPELIEILRKLP